MPDETTDEAVEPEKPESPLEAIRRAQANRVPPPGTGDRGAKGRKGHGSNPAAPRMYNRHK